MVRGIAMTTDTCRQPGDRSGVRDNVVDQNRLKDSAGPGRRSPFGLPCTDDASYLWIQLFHSALNEKARAVFEMADSASDTRVSGQELRRQLIKNRAAEVMVAVGTNIFCALMHSCI
jgi:type I restriction enzyme M protein